MLRLLGKNINRHTYGESRRVHCQFLRVSTLLSGQSYIFRGGIGLRSLVAMAYLTGCCVPMSGLHGHRCLSPSSHMLEYHVAIGYMYIYCNF